MSKKYNGGPAFPQAAIVDNHIVIDGGLTIRDWFAGQVLAGYSAIEDNRTYNPGPNKTLDELRAEYRANDAKYCYQMADAMLAARGEQ